MAVFGVKPTKEETQAAIDYIETFNPGEKDEEQD